MAVTDWSTDADENTSVGDINIAEHCPAKNINNAMREMMAELKNNDVDVKNYLIPVGSLIWSMATVAPAGFLVCDGSNISRTDYADLFAAIGTTYGTGDGESTFTLPNLIDKFLEGASKAGTYRSAGLPNITGTYSPKVGSASAASTTLSLVVDAGTSGAFYRDSNAPTGGQYVVPSSGSSWIGSISSHYPGLGINASRSSSIYGNSSTVQPPALTALPCIKY